MLRRRSLWAIGAVILGCLIAVALPAQGQRASAGQVGAPISATYKGLTTTRAYQPLPTTAPGPATAGGAGGPTVITTTHPAVHVEPLTDPLRRDYRLNAFYTKCLTIRGVLIVGSDKVSDWAFLEAAYTLDHQFMNSPPWVTSGLASTKVHLAIIADVEFTMDLPENQTPDMLAQAAYNDQRSRGLGGFPWCSCAEENLLNLRGDPYGGNNPQSGGENITLHEFSHTTASMIRSLQATTRPATTAASGPAGLGMGRGRPGRVEGPWGQNMDAAYAKSTAPGGRLYKYNQANNT